MTLLLDKPRLRRVVTVTATFLALLIVTFTSPVLFLIALAVDVVRSLTSGTPFMAVRILAFGWIYLIGEAWALAMLAITAPLSRERSIRVTYRLQDIWAWWNLRSAIALFGLRFTAEGEDDIAPGPIVLLSRHTSLIDTLLPSWFVSRAKGIRLRFVLKKELLLDPTLDIGGNRLPNHFLDRGSGDKDADLVALKALAEGLEGDTAVLIYPEGTRYSERKRERYTARFHGRTGRAAEIARGLQKVLPPRPTGTLALLEATMADVVVLAHRGLEGFARVKDMWAGGIVGSQIKVMFRRIPRAEIPSGRADRVTWLFEVWEDIDRWVTSDDSLAEAT